MLDSSFDLDLDLNLDFDLDEEKTQKIQEEEIAPVSSSKRRTKECTFFADKYLFKRAFSEVSLLDCLGMEDFKQSHSYNFITAGDVDALSYLKLMLRHNKTIKHLLISTWVISAEDILQLDEWIEGGVIQKLDLYLGEIFPKSYKIEFEMIKKLFKKYDCGRVAVFRNHSKIFAGTTEKYKFGIQMSCNINTNPRTENGCIIINDEIYDFYKSYFDDIKSFDL